MMKKFQHNFRIYRGRKNKFDIIGDIHGCYNELMELVEKLGYQNKGNCYAHPEGRILVSVGDVSDKGPENLKCLDFWMNQVNYGGSFWVYGNHCNKLYRYLMGNRVKLTHGLENTVQELEQLEQWQKRAFIHRFLETYERLCYYILLDHARLLVVHGGIKKEQIGHFNNKIKTMCIYGDIAGEFDENGKPIRRDWAQNYNGDIFIAYGHTVRQKPEFINNTIDLDQGCVYGGHLTALRYPEMKIVQVKSKFAYTTYQGAVKIEF